MEQPAPRGVLLGKIWWSEMELFNRLLQVHRKSEAALQAERAKADDAADVGKQLNAQPSNASLAGKPGRGKGKAGPPATAPGSGAPLAGSRTGNGMYINRDPLPPQRMTRQQPPQHVSGRTK